jgi:hypothetical protein
MLHLDVAVLWVATPSAYEGNARFESRPEKFPDWGLS